MLTQRDVSLKKLNLLKRNNELMGASGKLTMSINKPIYIEKDKMGLTPYKEESTCLRRGPMPKRNVLPQKITIEQIEKESGRLPKFMMNSNIEMKLGQLLKICF